MATATMNVSLPSTLLPAAKASGRCPPTLIRDEEIIEGGVFEMAMLRSLDRTSDALILSSEANAVGDFTSAMKMASGSSSARTLEQRRCLLLGAIGSTAETMPSNTTLQKLLASGLLVTIKGWLDDILEGKVGGIDLLLHLLSSITPLPVTKDWVTSSRLGKTVSAVEKHELCVGSANESAIKSRIQQVKERWSASVKALKNNGSSNNAKRTIDQSKPPVAKKARHGGGSSLSNLLKKVESTNNTVTSSTETAEETAKREKDEREAKLKETLALANSVKPAEATENVAATEGRPKKDSRRIHWADNSGKALAVAEGGEEAEPVKNDEPKKKKRKSRWAERKKKDIQHEKELLLQSRKPPTLDKDLDDELDAMAMMAIWKAPQLLPEDKANPPVQVDSNELKAQTSRMSSTPAVTYSSEAEVPISPTLLSEVEKALEQVNSSTPNVIPLFTPQAAAYPPAAASLHSVAPPAFPAPPQAPPAVSSGATLEQVLAMGLPYFLVGSNMQALQTLAANPGLLASFKDVNGVYKQPELINLVQTLSQNVAPPVVQPVPAPMPAYNAYNPMQAYQPSVTAYAQAPQQPVVQQAAVARGSGGYRGEQNAGDANLHLSGYGPTTTNAEIIAAFSPYVNVTEVVNKGTFSFVNTNDPEGAKRAREALNGSLLGGMPCRINPATRKKRDPNHGATPATAAAGIESLPRNSLGQVEFSQVKDDRGNPATKNLFVAGYGVGTTEQHLKDAFGQHATVVSVIMKGTFAFVNTSDRDQAVMARSALSGQQLNGGALRINFAKETGRLGTSFDSPHYGPAGSSTYGR